ncbi:MAG: 2-isopropylmalate synthase [Epsilonproteobacteria bacterium]|nr:2-isopropylmalate synthase [Campylobacterota bacterium]
MFEFVKIFDTTLRDGEQSPGASLNTGEKLKLAKQLAKLKVDIIEAGFAASSPGDFDAVNRVAKEVKGPIIASLARANEKDIRAAADAIGPASRKRIHTFIATSPVHVKRKLRMSYEEVLKKAVESVKLAKEYTEDVEFSPEDATRTERDYLVDIVSAVIDAGATTVNIPDTVGYTTPQEFFELISFLKRNVSNIDNVVISVHCHNDLGMATANSLSAILAGARQVECTLNGLGERAGNAALEEIVMALKTRHDFYNIDTKIDTRQIYSSSRLASQLTGIFIQRNKAIVGINAFAHEAGIHQDGVIKERTTYEIMKSEDIGLPGNKLILGKHSGRRGLVNRLSELGFENLKPETLENVFGRFKALADKKKEVTDDDLYALVASQSKTVPEIFKLVKLQVVSGNSSMPTATVRLQRNGTIFMDAAQGNGPVDAAYKAIERIIQIKVKLEDYQIKSVGEGKDAMGMVHVRVHFSDTGKTILGMGTHTDVIQASAAAFLDSINKNLFFKDVE